ncbi:MAG: OmpA family protein [Moraxella sp.]|nr:OmpA family protein [Moraxella sp.]
MATIIDALQEYVTPAVLEATPDLVGDVTAKKGALGALYTLLATRLTDVATVKRLGALTATEHQDGDALLGALFQNDGTPVATKVGIYDAIANNLNLPIDTVSGLSAIGLPAAYDYIKSLAGVVPVEEYLSSEREGLLSGLPNWLVALLPAGLFGLSSAAAAPVNPLVDTTPAPAPVVAPTATSSTPVAAPVAATTTVRKEEEKGGGFLKSLLPIIGLIILAALAWALLKACQKDPTPVAAPVQGATTAETATAAALAPAGLALALNGAGDALFSCEGTVGSDGLGEQIRTGIASVFGADSCKFDTSSATAAEMPAAQYLPQILGFMRGVPDASLSVNGTNILLNSSDATALQSLVDNVKGALPADFTVAAEPVLNEAEVVAGSIQASKAALEGLTDSSTLDDLVNALNLQIINFASDSSDIPAENQAILDLAAARLMALPDAHLVITGHTDSQGSHEYNQKLSERRAKAVHDYLVSKGVSDDKLEVVGASYDFPVATNGTEQGRFKNRRIQFTIFGQDGEKVATVGDTAAATTTVDTAAAAATTAATAVADTASAAASTVADAASTAAATVSDAATAAGEAVSNTTDKK